MASKQSKRTKQSLYKLRRENNEDSLNSPCFQINPDIELTDTPSTGEEYLLQVIRERQKDGFITKCDKDFTKFSRNQSYFVNEFHHAKAPTNLKPTIEWQNYHVADFSEIRMYISRMLIKKKLWPPNMRKLDIHPNNIEAWKALFENQESSLTLLMDAHSAVIDRGLEILTEILDDVEPGNTISYRTGEWIYAFLAFIRQPPLSDTISIIRDLARKCAEIRSHLDPDDVQSNYAAVPLNVVICIVARYFRQYDLAD